MLSGNLNRAGNAIFASVATFTALAVVSMATYPGGSWLAFKAQGHDLLRNFLCDLLGPTAINGQPNPTGSLAMMAAMGILALGLTLTWFVLPRLFDAPKLALAIRVCAVVSLLGLIAVPLTPPTVSYRLHAFAVFTGGAPGAAAWMLSLVGLAREPRTRRLAVLGVVALLFMLIGFALYSRQLFFGGGPTILLPASHRVATAIFLAWLVAIAVQLKQTPGGAAAPPGLMP